VAGFCEYGDEPAGSEATEIVIMTKSLVMSDYWFM
jgi:hypothetical protein